MMKTLFQASTWNALEAGSFDGAVSVRELLCCADTGVGIGTALDGVITFENGAACKTAPDGEVTVMRPEDGMAFAAAMAFDENAPEIALNGIDDLTSLKQMLAPFVQGNPNLFYMIKAGGVFKTMHTQSWNSCRKPYPVLSEAAKNRNEFRFENTRGNGIAVWCPRYVGGICMPDWHFHYLSRDKTQGGHVLDLSAERLHLKINRIWRFRHCRSCTCCGTDGRDPADAGDSDGGIRYPCFVQPVWPRLRRGGDDQYNAGFFTEGTGARRSCRSGTVQQDPIPNEILPILSKERTCCWLFTK